MSGIATPFNLTFTAASKLMDHVQATNYHPQPQFVASVLGERQVGAEG